MAEPINVVVTGAAGQIAYSLIYQLANGDCFGRNQKIRLHLLDIPPMMEVLSGVVMEIQDCAFPLVVGVVPTTDLAVAFKDADAAFMVGSMPRKQGMERKDLLSANVKIFKEQGMALDKYAKKSVLVLVVGNPANTNALMCSRYAKSIPKEQFTAMTRLDQNRAQAMAAAQIGVPVENVSNIIVWGNHSSTQFPDGLHASVKVNGSEKSLRSALSDDAWLTNTFVNSIQTRGAAVIAARKMSSAMSAAKAASDHMRDMWCGTPAGKYVSMAVMSDGSYEIPKDVMFSFPVTIAPRGKWTIVQGLEIDDFCRGKLDTTANELLEEKKEALSLCAD